MISPFASISSTNELFIDFNFFKQYMLNLEQIKINKYMKRNIYNIPINNKRSYEVKKYKSINNLSYYSGILNSSIKKKSVRFNDKDEIFVFQKSLSVSFDN